MPGSTFTGSLRSTIVAAFLATALTGCGNAQSGAPDTLVADTVSQDWETQPPLWVPRPILIPRAIPAATLPDSARTGDSTVADTTTGDSAKSVLPTVDS